MTITRALTGDKATFLPCRWHAPVEPADGRGSVFFVDLPIASGR